MGQVPASLERLIDGSLTAAQQRQLESEALQDSLRAKAFGINAKNAEAVIQQRSRLLPEVFSLLQRQQPHIQRQSLLECLWNLWLPLALKLIAQRQALDQPLIQGIVGVQGTGKSTLATVLVSILNHLGYPALSLSLDDLYKPYPERQRLQEQDSRLVWRGPPGTHDVQLGLQVLDQLRRQSGPVAVPRFDKSAQGGAGDRTSPELVEGAEIVLFEGWFVGVQPVDPALFATAPAPLLTAEDRAFALDTNDRLREYLPLWKRLDHLILLYLLDYRLSQQWRQQAEQQAAAAGRPGMSDAAIDQFVAYFWRSLHPDLFLKPLAKSDKVDLVIEINPDHAPGRVYRPSDLE